MTKTLKLDLSEVPHRNKSKVKKEIGDYIIEEILLSVSKEKSPIKNGSYKKGLSTEYRKIKGSNKANLELEGDLLDSLVSKNKKGDEIEIGIFNKEQTGKADGHNQMHKEHPTLPKRQFIPNEKQSFKKNIMNGVQKIIEQYKENRQPVQTESTIEQSATVEQSTGAFDFTLDDLLGRSFFDEFLE